MIALALAAALAAQNVTANEGAVHEGAVLDGGAAPKDAAGRADGAAASRAWCARAMPLASAAPAAPGGESDAFDALALAMPREADAVVARARELKGEEGLDRSMAVLRFAVIDACVSGAAGDDDSGGRASTEAMAAQAAALMTDPRFIGVRKGDGTFDRLMHKAYLWFISLVESEGMQKYAGGSRVVFLSLIGIGALALTVITLRKRRVESAASKGGGGDVQRKEAARKEAYASLRAQADALLAQGDARASMRAADAALLARVGELDDHAASVNAASRSKERAVTPARTHREIAARLPSHVSEVVRGPFATFDMLFFGRPHVDVNDARAFLASVDAAEASLARATTTSNATVRT